MTAVILDGRPVASEVKKQVALQVGQLAKRSIKPFLATIQVGDDPASSSYLRGKHKAAEEVGIQSENHHLPANTAQDKLEALLGQLNTNPRVHGILVQLPLPRGFDEDRIMERIIPYKDVDGLHPINEGKLAAGKEEIVPCTPKGIIKLLSHYKVPIAGQRAVIINRTTLVGRPLANLFLNRDATITVCHSKTPNLAKITETADILVSAVGRENFQIKPDHVMPKATVVDVGLTRVEGKLRGDVDFQAVSKLAGFITPVPGGVGPMTVACLLENTIQAATFQTKGA
ncbi:MAG: bifunctional 5,10-methylene-tetrahydrofolate dehydrogenase/5,10-methylene-tetrahydrofolate cyclohydrolase [Crenarchaeota archaeon 13_1_40CM_3_52_4]|nr:MAG: bifunctional 5,10-methylene-tetrahydrofolate dehydrogenase/5,10-methylene-tetrahydrofolate cyclohydrolase [Crenarchaeota archaeon 13_1_40CM_3_52_4]